MSSEKHITFADEDELARTASGTSIVGISDFQKTRQELKQELGEPDSLFYNEQLGPKDIKWDNDKWNGTENGDEWPSRKMGYYQSVEEKKKALAEVEKENAQERLKQQEKVKKLEASLGKDWKVTNVDKKGITLCNVVTGLCMVVGALAIGVGLAAKSVGILGGKTRRKKRIYKKTRRHRKK
jgi:hypothetical protein